MKPDTEDAKLLVSLAQWGTALGLDEAVSALWRNDFDPEAGSVSDRHVRCVLQFGETIGTLVKNELLNRDLVLDWLWVAGMWGRVGPAAVKERERHGEPRLYENFEALATWPDRQETTVSARGAIE